MSNREAGNGLPGNSFYGRRLLLRGKDIVQLKILSDRRHEGGGCLASQVPPPPVQADKIVVPRAFGMSTSLTLQGGKLGNEGLSTRALRRRYTLKTKGKRTCALIGAKRWVSSLYRGEAGRDRVDDSSRCRRVTQRYLSAPRSKEDLGILWEFSGDRGRSSRIA